MKEENSFWFSFTVHRGANETFLSRSLQHFNFPCPGRCWFTIHNWAGNIVFRFYFYVKKNNPVLHRFLIVSMLPFHLQRKQILKVMLLQYLPAIIFHRCTTFEANPRTTAQVLPLSILTPWWLTS